MSELNSTPDRLDAHLAASRFAELLDYYATPDLRCLIFKPYAGTLETVLQDRSLTPLPSFQTRDIGLQLLHATDCERDNSNNFAVN